MHNVCYIVNLYKSVICVISADVIADGCPYDEESQCTIRLDDNSVVCLRAVNRYLALVCQLPVQHYRYEGCIVYILCDQDNDVKSHVKTKTFSVFGQHQGKILLSQNQDSGLT